MNEKERVLNYLHLADAEKILNQRDSEAKKAKVEAIRKQENENKETEKAVWHKKRLNELAKPKDKWKVGKELMALQSKFPHDRVLQRMVKEEFKENQVFRYPEEYDVYRNADEEPKRIKQQEKGLRKPDYAAGEAKLETFKKTDTIDHNDMKREKLIE